MALAEDRLNTAKLGKEAFIGGPKAFRSDAELKGTGKQPPAKYPNYLPVWDAEKKWVPYPQSVPQSG